jgi:hypothetical protein
VRSKRNTIALTTLLPEASGTTRTYDLGSLSPEAPGAPCQESPGIPQPVAKDTLSATQLETSGTTRAYAQSASSPEALATPCQECPGTAPWPLTKLQFVPLLP